MGPTPRLNLLRIVLDTNVLVSALLFRGGSLGWLIDAWQSESVSPLASKATVAELLRVLGYRKFRLAAADRETLLEEYLPWCETVTVPAAVEVPDCRDPGDRIFLELAAAAGADALVTGDEDLLALRAEFTIPILTPAAMRDLLTGSWPFPHTR